MKMLKKSGISRILAGLLALVFVFGLTACGGKEEVAPEVKNVKIEAMQDATYGRVGDLHKLSYEVGEGCSVSVSVTKGDVAATADDYSYTTGSKTLVFKTVGDYKVTVFAAKDGMLGSGNAEISVTAYEAPVLSVSGKHTVAEEEALLITRNVSYSAGDCAEEERVASVEYKAAQNGEYVVADAALYSMEDDLFIPHDVGYFRINYEATGIRGGKGSASYELLATPAKLTLESDEELSRIPVGVDTRLNYTVKGAAEKYNVTVSSESGNVVAKAEEGGVKVRMNESDFGSVTVTYTHKKDNSKKYTLQFTTHAVEDVDKSPVFEGDPFGDMPDTLLVSIGYLFDAENVHTASGGRAIPLRNISYEVVNKNITKGDVEILNAAGDKSYPYVIASNYQDNSATGTFTLKMTATDPATGKSASATKKFSLLPTGYNGDDDSAAVAKICNYLNEHSDYYDMGAMDLTGLVPDTRHNVVLTKAGVIMQRTNPNWVLHGPDGSENADFAYIKPAAATNSCVMDFKMTVLGTNGGKVKLGIGIRTVNFNGWVGYLNIENENGMIVANLDSGVTKSSFTGAESAAQNIPAQEGTVMYFRLQRTTSGSTATYTLLVKTDEAGEYAKMCTFTASTSANTGKALAAYQFSHREGGGCYMIENVTIS